MPNLTDHPELYGKGVIWMMETRKAPMGAFLVSQNCQNDQAFSNAGVACRPIASTIDLATGRLPAIR
jgi:hypothetical protein